jgi:formylglycine-generating enzyme required for sulfatase activity
MSNPDDASQQFPSGRRKPMAAAVALVTLLLVAGVVWKYFDLERQKGLARAKEEEATAKASLAIKARDFLLSIFQFSDANGQQTAMTARQILEDAEKRIPQEFADQPELREELLSAIGAVYAKITANAPLAMILEVRGPVQLHSSRDPKAQPVPQAMLYAGDRLTLAKDAGVQLVILSDLHKERLKPETEATVRRKGCEPADAVGECGDDVLMTFVRLPKGTFYMGWDDGGGIETEIKNDFEIAVHAVTQGQWQAVMGDNPSWFSRFGGGRNEVKNISDEELKLFPVENVSWDDAQKFIKKLNDQNRGGRYVYRLPTEEEWEYACRGGATSEEECSHHFYFAKPTNDLSSEQANFNGESPVGKGPKGKYLGRTTRVGAYPPNKLGLCDMQGNVWHWCSDPMAPEKAGSIIRGGSWHSNGVYCRAANGVTFAPAGKDRDLGLRLARVIR